MRWKENPFRNVSNSLSCFINYLKKSSAAAVIKKKVTTNETQKKKKEEEEGKAEMSMTKWNLWFGIN